MRDYHIDPKVVGDWSASQDSREWLSITCTPQDGGDVGSASIEGGSRGTLRGVAMSRARVTLCSLAPDGMGSGVVSYCLGPDGDTLDARWAYQGLTTLGQGHATRKAGGPGFVGTWVIQYMLAGSAQPPLQLDIREAPWGNTLDWSTVPSSTSPSERKYQGIGRVYDDELLVAWAPPGQEVQAALLSPLLESSPLRLDVTFVTAPQAYARRPSG